MMGQSEPQEIFFHAVTLEQLVPQDHPLRKIRKLVDAQRIRELCKDYYCADNGRPSIPPEQLFLAWLGGYLLGCRSDRVIVRQLTCDMAFRWFVGLDIGAKVWDDSTFARNRCERFEGTDIFERLFDDTIKRAAREGWVSDHWSVDGTLVRANASNKSFVPIELHQTPEQYRDTISGRKKTERRGKGDDDKGNTAVDFRGEKRTNATHRSTSDPDARLANKSGQGKAQPGYTVNGIMENRHRFLMGIGVETFRASGSERDGALSLLERAKRKLGLRPKTLGADKGYFETKFLSRLLDWRIEPHVSAMKLGSDLIHRRVRMRARGLGFIHSQRARKKIEELWGEAKESHGLRRFVRRGLERVRQEAHLIGWLLNLKRIAKLSAAPA